MRINRRNFLAAGAGMLAGSVSGIAKGSTPRPSVSVAVPKISTSNTLDTLREQSNVGERIFLPNMWEPLIGRNLRGQLEAIPMLATSWRRIDDSTVELNLRKGVKFHNGDELTADDVVFTFSPERMFGKTTPKTRDTIKATGRLPGTFAGKALPPDVPGAARRLWPDLVSVEAVDRYTVRFHNASKDVVMEGRFLQTGSAILSRRGWEDAKSYIDWARKPITTGPYMIERYVPEVELVLVAHDDYWGGRPPLQRIRYVEVPETASRINGLLSGEYQFACDIPPDLIGEVEKDGRFEVLGGPVSNHRVIVFDRQNPQFINPLVRRALTHSIDRQKIVDTLWAGRTAVPKGLQWPFYGDMFHADWSLPEFNPALASELLKKANYKGDAIPYRILNNYYTNQNATAQIMVEMWQSVGLNVEIQVRENWSQILENNGRRAIRDFSSSAAYNDPVAAIVGTFGPHGRVQQVGEWSNAEANQLCEVLETSLDPAVRRKAVRRLMEICEREDPAYTVLHQTATFTAKPKAIKWKAAPSFAMDFGPGAIEI